MIKTFLIDDEPESIQTISSLIEVSCPNVSIEGKFTDPFEGLRAILDNKPDVILLDIEMPGMTGFELLRRLPSIEFEVIFITAYNDYAIHAFKLSAIDYLLKPVDPDELVTALEKAEQSIARKRIVNQFEILDGLLNKNHDIRRNQENNIALPIFEGLMYLQMSNIIRVEAEKNYCKFWLKEGKPVVISKNIGTYESSLATFGFMRIHRSHIINLCRVMKFIRQDGVYVQMEDGFKIPVSNSKREELLKRLEDI